MVNALEITVPNIVVSPEQLFAMGISVDGGVPIERTLVTSTCNLIFTGPDPEAVEPMVYKLWSHEHPVISDLNSPGTRHAYLAGEMALGIGGDDIYLGVLPVCVIDMPSAPMLMENTSLDEISPDLPFDWALKMKCFPAERQMDIMYQKGQLTRAHVEDATVGIIDGHIKAPALQDLYEETKMAEMKANLAGEIEATYNFDLMAELAAKQIMEGEQVESLGTRTRQFLTARIADFVEAIDRREVRFSHGDTKLTNGFIGDGRVGSLDKASILDGISFKPEWTINDLLSDLAYFLLYFAYIVPEQNINVDNEANNFEHWLDIVDQKYRESIGKDKPSLRTNPNFWFYMSYRAEVQAKVAAIEASKRLGKEDDGVFVDKKDEAARFLEHSEKFLQQAFTLAGLEW